MRKRMHAVQLKLIINRFLPFIALTPIARLRLAVERTPELSMCGGKKLAAQLAERLAADERTRTAKIGRLLDAFA